MKLEEIGYDGWFDRFRGENGISPEHTGRVVAEHRERYSVMTESGEYDSEITGNLRFSAVSAEEFPAVGDWVELSTYEHHFAVIHRIFARKTVMKRQEAGRNGRVQVIAANIDIAFVIQALDRDHSLNRLERYLTLCHASRVQPYILISKTDLPEEEQSGILLQQIRARVGDIPVMGFSNVTGSGLNEIRALLEAGKTYCLLGSSGVGKSTLINHLSGRTTMKTGNINARTGRGRHVTSHRQMIVLEGGAILVDTPGMREVGIGDGGEGLDTTFGAIEMISRKCRFTDCTHVSESGCAVIMAVEKGTIDGALYENYLKLVREKMHFDSTVAERRRRDKEFGKMLKNYKKEMKRNRPDQ